MESEKLKKLDRLMDNFNRPYGFFIPIHVFDDYKAGHDNEPNTVDIDYIEVTDETKLIEK